MTIRLITPEERAAGLRPNNAELAARARMASGPHLPDPDEGSQWRATMKMYAAEEERARAANGGRLPHFATGTTDQSIPAELRNHATRQIDDPEDADHSPSMVEGEPDFSVAEIMAERARQRADLGEEPIEDVTLPEGELPYTPPPAPTANRVQIAGD